MKTKWSYLDNVFENATRSNYLRMLKLSHYHYNAILSKTGDPFFDELIGTYEPLHKQYVKLYERWTSSRGVGKGKRIGLQQLFDELSARHIIRWDIAIQSVYPRNTPRYMELLPQKRIPFQNKSLHHRMTALKSLGDNLSGEAALLAVKSEIQALYSEMSVALAMQQGQKSTTTALSKTLEKARIALAEIQFRNLAQLLVHYYKNTLAVAAYFDLQNIRRPQQKSIVLNYDSND